MNIADQDHRTFSSCTCPAAIAGHSPTVVEESGHTQVNEIGVISGIRKIMLPRNKPGDTGSTIGAGVMPDQKFREGKSWGESCGESWIEIMPPSRAIALAMTGSDAARGQRIADQDGQSLDDALRGIGVFLNCEDVERTCRDLTKRGVRFLAPPENSALGCFRIFEDTDGRRYVLGQW